MATLGSGVVVACKGATVRHPLWPELGTGQVISVTSESINTANRTARVRWSTGQVSRHNLAVLREVAG